MHFQTVHENAKPFTCLIWNQPFGQKGVLNRHIKTIHENAKPFTVGVTTNHSDKK